MAEASYRAMNKAAKAVSNRISSISTSTSKPNYSGIIKSVVTATADTFIAKKNKFHIKRI